MEKQRLAELARMSQAVGARVDYVQGGGGNTSVKLEGGLMAIKASGLRLNQVTESDGFAVVETATLKDVTTERGYKPLRPSVEASFHALLGRYVLHTHAVYANLALCSQGGEARLPEILHGYRYAVVPYINPGAELAEAIRAQLTEDTQAVCMLNHGLVATAETAEECLRIHEDINQRCAAAYGVSAKDFDAFAGEINTVLYPDQQVYLTLTDPQREILAAVMFIQFTLRARGEKVRGMDERAMRFIAGWESEAYRKTILK
jgi:rhamnose utilization protein RhaD (predicted bifunctional aldolase and dehydrogenase)